VFLTINRQNPNSVFIDSSRRSSPLNRIAIPFLLALLHGDLAQAAHPLISDDTGTQGKGRYQFELTVEQGLEDENYANRTARAMSVTLSYGVRDNVDAIVTLPFSTSARKAAVTARRTTAFPTRGSTLNGVSMKEEI
jgi:hypothetical protein